MSSQSQKNPNRTSNLSMGPHSKLHQKNMNTSSMDVSASTQDGGSSISVVEKPSATAPSSNKKSNNQQTKAGSKTGLVDNKKENGHENDSTTIKSTTNGTNSENKNVSASASASASGVDAKKVTIAVDNKKSGAGKMHEEKTTGLANTAGVATAAAVATTTVTTQSEAQKNVKNKDIVGSDVDMVAAATANNTSSGSVGTSSSELQEKPNKLSGSLRESPRQKELKDREINEKDKQNGEKNVANTSGVSTATGNTSAVRESPRQREMKERDLEKDKNTTVSAAAGAGTTTAATLQRDSPKVKGQNNQNDDEKLMSQTKITTTIPTPTTDKNDENESSSSSSSPLKPGKGKVLKYNKDEWMQTSDATSIVYKPNEEKSTYTPASQSLSTSTSTSTMTTTQTKTSLLYSPVKRTSTPNKYTPNYNSSLRTISGRRSVRPMGELTLQYPTVRNESYRKIPNDFYDSYSSVNATFGSDTRNTSATSTTTHSGKRTVKRTFPTDDDYDDNNLVDYDADADDNDDDYDDIELKDLTPKKPRMEYITNFLGFVASPVTLLRAKFKRTNMHSTPNDSADSSINMDNDCKIPSTQDEQQQQQQQQESAQAKSSGISMEATASDPDKQLNESDEKITGLKMDLSCNTSGNDGISVDVENGKPTDDDSSIHQKNDSSAVTEATEDIEMEKLTTLKEITTENMDIIDQQKQQQQQEIESAKKVGRCMIM